MTILANVNLREQVESELQWDPAAADCIGVSAALGIVTLTGPVPSFAAKLAAEHAALRVHGVRAVANQLEVKCENERTDVDLAGDAASTLAFNIQVPRTVTVIVRHGFLTLEGEVHWMFEKTAAENAVGHLRGVIGLSNEIRVRPRVSQPVLLGRIEEALGRNADTDATGLSVFVADTCVTLSGHVRTYAQKRAAENAAWSAPGVTNVDNRIEVANS